MRQPHSSGMKSCQTVPHLSGTPSVYVFRIFQNNCILRLPPFFLFHDTVSTVLSIVLHSFIFFFFLSYSRRSVLLYCLNLLAKSWPMRTCRFNTYQLRINRIKRCLYIRGTLSFTDIACRRISWLVTTVRGGAGQCCTEYVVLFVGFYMFFVKIVFSSQKYYLHNISGLRNTHYGKRQTSRIKSCSYLQSLLEDSCHSPPSYSYYY